MHVLHKPIFMGSPCPESISQNSKIVITDPTGVSILWFREEIRMHARSSQNYQPSSVYCFVGSLLPYEQSSEREGGRAGKQVDIEVKIRSFR